MPLQTQVLVIGAGPAGTAAACFLAQRGVQVILADQCTFPRDKTCGDGISPAGVRVLMRMGILSPASLAGASHRFFVGVRIVAPGGASVDLHYPWARRHRDSALGCVIPRHELDAALVEAATSAGATFMPDFRATEPIWTSTGIRGYRGTCNRQSIAIDADSTIVATGARLRLPRALGLCQALPPSTIGIRGYLRLPSSVFPQPYLHVYLERRLLPDYAWIFPVDDRLVNVGLTCADSHRLPGQGHLTTLWRRFVADGPAADHLSGAVLVSEPRAAPLRADFLRRKAHAAGVLVAGEAAGLVDPLTGEGISFALQSGELAARAAYEALLAHEPEHCLRSYDRSLRHRFASYFRFAWALRRRLTDPCLADALVKMAALLKQVRADGWNSAAAAQTARFVLHSLPTLRRVPYLAFRMLSVRSQRIEV